MRKKETAEEFMARLNADPEYRKRRAEQEARLAEQEARFRIEEAPIINDLVKVGLQVNSAWDLVDMSTPYPDAIPVLIDHLRRPYSDRILEGIGRALGVPEAGYAWSTLRSEYLKAPENSEAKIGLAIALAGASNDMMIDDLAALAGDPNNGDTRTFLLFGLKKLKSKAAKDALTRLASDPILKEAMDSLDKLMRSQKVRRKAAMREVS